MRQLTIDLFLSHENLIAHIARGFNETTGFDTDELISYGRSVLIANARKWEPTRGKFSTFLYWLLRSSFTDYIHKQRKEVFVDVYEESVEAPESYSALPTRLSDLLENLSEDARALITISLESKWNENWHNLAEQLQKLMLKQGWDEVRFQTAFAEVQLQVKEW